jgi:integrase/recombinase XerC
MNLLQSIDGYEQYLRLERQLSKATIRAYLGDIKDLARWGGDVPVQTVERDHLRGYIRHMKEAGRARATIQRRCWGFATFFKWARYERLVTALPTDGLILPRKKKTEHTYLSESQMWTFVDTVTTGKHALRDRAAWRLLAFLGLRRGEVIGLRVEDVRLDDRIIILRDTKDGSDAQVNIPDAIVNDLKAAIAGRAAGYVCAAPEGGEWHGQDFTAAFRRHLKRCGLDGLGITAHSIRHTFAVMMVRAGVHITDVQHLMRHKEIRTTMQYIHHDPEGIKAALHKHPLLKKAS